MKLYILGVYQAKPTRRTRRTRWAGRTTRARLAENKIILTSKSS